MQMSFPSQYISKYLEINSCLSVAISQVKKAFVIVELGIAIEQIYIYFTRCFLP